MPPGVDSLPLVGSFAFQSDGRPLHNIQIDPSNPLNIHAVITDATDPSAKDTALLLTRRCLYTFSSDGGLTWKKPVTFSTVRTGYADMQLFKRNGQYVPIIAAHRVISTGASAIETGVWIEKGNPGDGNFSESLAPQVTAGGTSGSQIAWPTVAMSPTNDTAYVLATVNPPTGGSVDQLQFGRFILDAAKDSAVFDGTQWDAAPGSGDQNNPNAGLAGAGGEVRIRVAPSGKIGVFWVNADANTPDLGLYFAESTDGGNTWPTTLNALWNPGNQPTDANGAQLAPTNGDVDFWYDKENPKFLFLLAPVILSNQTYYPSGASLIFSPDTTGNNTVPIISPIITGAQDAAAFEQTDKTTETIRAPDAFISWATVARTPDSNVFAVFYQTYVEGDTEQINSPADPTQDTSFVFGSIYYQQTNDGGASWSAATPLLAASATTPEIDYRQPMTSDFNALGASGAQYKVAVVMDTAPGNLYRNGIYGFDLHNFGVASVGVSAVNTLQPSQSGGVIPTIFPNPIASSANIQFTLASESTVLLTVSDMLGRTVETLANGRMGTGEHTAVFQSGDLPNGVYRYTLRVNGESVTKSMSLLR